MPNNTKHPHCNLGWRSPTPQNRLLSTMVKFLRNEFLNANKFRGMLLLAACVWGTANAALIEINEQSPSFTIDSVGQTSLSTGSEQDDTVRLESTRVAGFDSTLGNLVDVSLSLVSSFALQNVLIGTPGSSLSLGQQAMRASIYSSSTGEFRDIFYAPQVTSNCNTGATSCASNIDGYFNATFDTSGLLDEFIDLDLGVLINFVSDLKSFSYCGGGDTCASLSTSTWTGKFVAQYLYDDGVTSVEPPSSNSVPEPATFALFGTGLIGLGFSRRKSSNNRGNNRGQTTVFQGISTNSIY